MNIFADTLAKAVVGFLNYDHHTVRSPSGPVFTIVESRDIGVPGPDQKHGKVAIKVAAPAVLGGSGLWFIISEGSGKMEVQAMWPNDHKGARTEPGQFIADAIAEALGGFPLDITVSAGREPGAIARDITRRVIGQMVKFTALIDEAIERNRQLDVNVRLQFHKLALTLGYPADHIQEPESYPLRIRSMDGSAEFSVNMAGKIEVKLRQLNISEAQDLIRALDLNS